VFEDVKGANLVTPSESSHLKRRGNVTLYRALDISDVKVRIILVNLVATPEIQSHRCFASSSSSFATNPHRQRWRGGSIKGLPRSLETLGMGGLMTSISSTCSPKPALTIALPCVSPTFISWPTSKTEPGFCTNILTSMAPLGERAGCPALPVRSLLR